MPVPDPQRGPETRPGGGGRRWLLRLVGSATVLTLLLVLLPTDELGRALARIPVWGWVVAVPGYLSLHLIGVTKWRGLINAARGGLHWAGAVRCYYWGLFGNIFLPSLVGGDAVRVALAFRLAGNKSGVLFGSVLDRLLDVAGLALLAGLGALAIPGALDPGLRRIFWFLGAAGGAAVLGLVVVVALLPARRLPMRIRRVLARMRSAYRALGRRPGRILVAFLLGVGLQASLVVAQAFIGRAVGIDIPFLAWLFAWPMAKISALAPVTQGGIGVREAALAALLTPFGVEPVLAVAAGLVFQAMVLAGGLTAGALSFALGRGRRPESPVSAAHPGSDGVRSIR